MNHAWHVVSAEYPPRFGGVSDYTAQVVDGLARIGCEVHVWTGHESIEGEAKQPLPDDAPGVIVHRPIKSWRSDGDLARLSSALDHFPPRRNLLIQHTPNAWGRRGTNLRFPRWARRRWRIGDRIHLMVHEPAYPFLLRDRPDHWILALLHRLILRNLLASSDRVYTSCSAFRSFVRKYDPRPDRPCEWLPVPSNIPVVSDPDAVKAARNKFAPPGSTLIATFGSFGSLTVPSLHEIITGLIDGMQERYYLLIGPESERFASLLIERKPGLQERVHAVGAVEAHDVSIYLQSADVLLQLYLDGPTTRRTTLMTGLSHGKPIITADGLNTDPVWKELGCVAIAPSNVAHDVLPVAEQLLASEAKRRKLADTARRVYDERFALRHTLDALLDGIQCPVS